jgi:hypothetical protein
LVSWGSRESGKACGQVGTDEQQAAGVCDGNLEWGLVVQVEEERGLSLSQASGVSRRGSPGGQVVGEAPERFSTGAVGGASYSGCEIAPASRSARAWAVWSLGVV